MTDMFMLLLLPGGGDELQGIKRGIMELADLILINKADDELVSLAERSAVEYRNALRLLQPRSPHWKAQVQTCSARDGTGVVDAWEQVLQHHAALDGADELAQRRAAQARDWMWSEINDALLVTLQNDPVIRQQIPDLEIAVSENRMSPVTAARRLLDLFLRQSG